MALRHLLGRANTTIAHAHLRPNMGLLGYPIKDNFLNCSPSSSSPSSAFSHRHESSIPTLECGGSGTCIYKGAQKDDWIISLAQFAVNKHNQDEDAHLQFVRVVGASHIRLCNLPYYITLEAVDSGKQKIYHAMIWMQLWKNFMELLVWKPVEDALLTVGVKRGDIKLHEAVMFHMNQIKQDHFRV